EELDQSGDAWRDQAGEPDRQVEDRREDAPGRQDSRDVSGLEEDVEEDRRSHAEEDRGNVGAGSERMQNDQGMQLLGVECGAMTRLQIDLEDRERADDPYRPERRLGGPEQQRHEREVPIDRFPS